MHPRQFDMEPEAPDAESRWTHWHATFENFLRTVQVENPERQINKLGLLTNYISYSMHTTIAECTHYEEAIAAQENIYRKPKNEIFSRHVLLTRRQHDESLEQYLKELRKLGKDCNFRPMSAVEIRDEHIMDAFINGLQNAKIRQRLLENKHLDLKTAYEQAYTLELAERQSAFYVQPDTIGAASNAHPSCSYPTGMSSFSSQEVQDSSNPLEIPITAASGGK